jgi:aminoglycoside phosphotransferase (APT) family kinase protein
MSVDMQTDVPASKAALYSALRAQLEPWYRKRAGLERARIVRIGPVSSGAINESYFLTVSYDDRGTERTAEHVLRIQPRLETAIPEVDVGEQAQTLRGLSGVRALPIPKVFFNEPETSWLGRPFYVMERLPGEPLFDLKKLPDDPAQRRSLYTQAVRALVTIHGIDWQAAGMDHLRDVPVGQKIIAGQLQGYRRILTDSSEGERYALLERGYEWLADNLPAERAAVLNWGDARIGNLLFDGTRLSAVLDWELATIAPREVDLGWFLFFERFLWSPDSYGAVGTEPIMSREEIIRLYEQESGVSLTDLPWFERWAAFRLAVMRMRAGRQAKKRGEEPPSSRVDEVNFATIFMARLFGWPEPA